MQEIRKKIELGKIVNFINGNAFKPSDWKDTGIPIIRIQNLNGSKEFNYFNGNIEPRYIVENNQLLFSWSGSRGTSFGPHIWNGGKGVLNQHIFKVVPKKEIDASYLFYEFKRITKEIEQNAHGSAGLVHITKGDLEQFEIYLPEQKEQEKIAQILSTLDQNIKKTRATIEKYKRIKKGLMDDLLNGKIRIKKGKWIRETEFKEVEGIGKIPKDWAVRVCKSIAVINMGQSPSSENYNEDGKGMYLIQGNADCKNKRTSPRIWTTEVTKTCDIGDIIMTVRAPAGEIAKSYHNACIGRGVCSIKFNYDNDYLYYYFLNIEKYWEKLAQGTTFTAISSKDIQNLKLIIPKLETEQKEISNILSKQDQLIEKEKQYLQKLQRLKNGLMGDLLTGEKRVKF